MSKIQMIRRNRVFNVDARLAPLLERRGGYLRRDMQAQSAAGLPPKHDSQALEAKRAAAQAKRDAAAAAKTAAKPAKKAATKAAKKAVAKTAAITPAPNKDASE
jgi:hypothetical protein